ncbi:unnamed protein product [Meloidogyne enterolobii]|uniref:Uncharacterized protein n=1 Tax=Meloidogyne enterolobii TaxID=390850 RepID=A0ACB0ZCP8_MELEN
MQEALDRVKREMPPSIAESEILGFFLIFLNLCLFLEYLAFALFKQGNIKQALITTDRLYQIAPSHPRAKGNIKWFVINLYFGKIKVFLSGTSLDIQNPNFFSQPVTSLISLVLHNLKNIFGKFS